MKVEVMMFLVGEERKGGRWDLVRLNGLSFILPWALLRRWGVGDRSW